MPTGPDVVLAELDLGHVIARAVRTRLSDELRETLAAGGVTGGIAVGDEMVEVRFGDRLAGFVLSERPTMIGLDDSRALVYGLVPDGAVRVEAVAPGGDRVPCTVGPGVWLVVLPDNELGAELYPVLFRDPDGAPVNPGLPADWERDAIGAREVPCPACGANAWDLVTAAWEGSGALRNTRWGHNPAGPGKAFVCRTCGHEERVGYSVTFARRTRNYRDSPVP
jgi:hypothetical protein